MFNIRWSKLSSRMQSKIRCRFYNKLRIVEEESDETSYWLEILEEACLIEPSKVERLKKEVNEITAIIVASQKTMLKKR